MFDEARDPVSVLEERELLQQIASLGVGYPHAKPCWSNAAISNANTIHRYISSIVNLQENPNVGHITHEDEKRIRNGEVGYYLIDLCNGHILSKGKHPIDDIIVDFTLLDTYDRIQIRRRKGDRLYDVAFLIAPKGVLFVGVNRACIPLSEFHMMSFIGSSDKARYGFAVDYDVAQNDRPLVFFPCEENYDIIQAQLDQDTRCLIKEYKSLYGDIDIDWKKLRRNGK